MNTIQLGGGIANYGTAELVNATTSGAPGQEVYLEAPATIALDNHNLFGHSVQTTAQALSGVVPGGTDRTATSDGTHPAALPKILQPLLADNGGKTHTHALVSGSPALDSAPNAACAAPPVNGVDQRRFARNLNGIGAPGNSDCDTGAVEYGLDRTYLPVISGAP